MLAELIVQMATDPSFAAWVRADLRRAGREYGLSDSELAQLATLVDAADEPGPVALAPRLSKSGLFAPGLLTGPHPAHLGDVGHHSVDAGHVAQHGEAVPMADSGHSAVEWYDGVVTGYEDGRSVSESVDVRNTLVTGVVFADHSTHSVVTHMDGSVDWFYADGDGRVSGTGHVTGYGTTR